MKRIKSIKKPEESFSDAVELVNKVKKKPLSDFLGKWSGSEDEIENIKKVIEEGRKKFKTREVVLDWFIVLTQILNFRKKVNKHKK